MTGKTILIVEDELSIQQRVKEFFESEGYVVKTASDGEKGLNLALKIRPDLIILDVVLPGINGFEICRSIREQELFMPIIMLTSRNHESDVVLGLNIGANDYVAKPFSLKELSARARAALRSPGKENETIHFSDFSLNLRSRTLTKKGKELPATPKEFNLLVLFAKEPGRAFTRDQILNAVWGHDITVTPRSVDRFINTLRNLIEPDPNNPVYIKTVREVGYRFETNDAASKKRNHTTHSH